METKQIPHGGVLVATGVSVTFPGMPIDSPIAHFFEELRQSDLFDLVGDTTLRRYRAGYVPLVVQFMLVRPQLIEALKRDVEGLTDAESESLMKKMRLEAQGRKDARRKQAKGKKR